MVMLEAAASGLPVIAANQPSIAEALQGNGILYNTLMDDELANAVRVFADDKRVNKEAKNMRHLYEYLFSPMVALRTLEEIYASA